MRSCCLILLLLSCCLARAQVTDESPVAIASVKAPEQVTAGQAFDVLVKVTIKAPFHIYGLADAEFVHPTKVLPGGGDGRVSSAGKVTASKEPLLKQDDTVSYDYWEEEVTFTVPLKVKGAAGPLAFDIQLDHMACTMEFCLPPKVLSSSVKVEVLEGDSPVEEEEPVPTKQPEQARPSGPANARFLSEHIEPNESFDFEVELPHDGATAGSAVQPKMLRFEGSSLSASGEGTVVATASGLVLRIPVEVAATGVTEGELAFKGTLEVGGNRISFAGTTDVEVPILGFLIIAAVAALFALLTPCVFPMIPITVSFFTKQAETSKASPVAMGFLYALGIVVSFTAIGFFFTLGLGGAGAATFALYWGTQLFIALLFIVFALSLFGLFEIQLPESVMNLVGRAQGKGGALGVWLLGTLFAVTTFTCTAPFIGAILAEAYASGQWLRPIMGMVVFSTVLAIPFFFLSAFPSRLKSLPRSGGWLNQVKVCMGFIELAAAFKFLGGMDMYLGWDLFTRGFIIAVWVAIFAVMGFYLLGAFRLPHDSPVEKVGVWSMMFAIISIAFAAWLTQGLNGTELNGDIDAYLPPELEHRSPSEKTDHLVNLIVKRLGGGMIDGKTGMDDKFVDDYPGARAEAMRLKVPIFIEFTAPG
jgi:thiol:disulfide interchange protein DsbD